MTQKEMLLKLLEAISKKMVEVEPELTELDSKVGDGDCGLGIKTGFKAVLENLPELSGMSMGMMLKKTGMLLVSNIGGTSGAILGTAFMRMGAKIGDRESLTCVEAGEVLASGMQGMIERGENTQVGDKTMIDAVFPAVEAFNEKAVAGEDIKTIMTAAAAAAKKGSDSTIELIAKKGRASYLGERSIGYRDAGSMAIYYMFEAASELF